MSANFLPVSKSSTSSTVLKPPSAIWRIILYLGKNCCLSFSWFWVNTKIRQVSLLLRNYLFPSTVTVLLRQPRTQPIPASFSTTNCDKTKAICSLDLKVSWVRCSGEGSENPEDTVGVVFFLESQFNITGICNIFAGGQIWCAKSAKHRLLG